MTDERWSRVRSLFEHALELPPEERDAYLAREADGDTDLLAAARRLLASSTAEDDFLVSPLPSAGAEILPADAVASLPTLRPGDRIGAYEIERVLGAGGMGTVYVAHQERPARPVALKVMRTRLRSSEALGRFRREADILGRLRHPGIATVYEMGMHRFPSGEGGQDLPFLAMELVEGARDLLSYAREEDLALPAKLALFTEVCEAVHHGHRKGVIHRDLKPGNVLVDGTGRARVIDYGVARVAEEDLGYETQTGQLIGTLQYLAPEQLQGEVADAASDVWALGVLLYELLTGAPPCDVRSRSFTEVVEEICNRTPARPSARKERLPDELDWITLKALEKDPARRYVSAAELASDLERFRNHEPVIAGPPSRRYLATKFVRRHRLGVAAAAALSVTLIGGIVGTSLGMIEAESKRVDAVAARRDEQRARERAEGAEAEARSAEAEAREDRNRALEAEREAIAAREAEKSQRETAEHEAKRARTALSFVESAFAGMAPRLGGTRDLPMVDFLALATEQLDRGGFDDPSVELTLRQLIGRAYLSLGRNAEAEPHVARAHALALSLHGPDAYVTNRALVEHTGLVLRTGTLPDAQALVADTVTRTRELFGEDDLLHVDALHNQALQAFWSGAYDRARPLLAELVLRFQETHGPEAAITITIQNDYANCLIGLGETEEAKELLADALAASRRTLHANHPDLVSSIGSLGAVELQRGRLAEAEDLLRQALSESERVLGPRSEVGLRAAINLALVLKKRGKYAEAEERYRAAVALGAEVLGPESLDLLVLRGNLATLLHARGRHEEAAELLSEVLAERQRLLPPDHPATRLVMNNLAGLYEDMSRRSEAEELYRGALELELQFAGEHGPRVPFFRSNLAGLLTELGRLDEAEQLLVGVEEELGRRVPDEHPDLLRVRRRRAFLERARGRWEAALVILEQLFPSCERVHGPAGVETLESGRALVDALFHTGRETEAEELRRTLYERARTALGETHAATMRLK